MRNISFALTTEQFRNRTKRVTRRLGWKFLKGGEHLMGCEKCQGLKKGQTVNRLGEIVVEDARREPLNAIDQDDVIAEGFPDMTPDEFVEMFCRHNRCAPDEEITRIAYDYVD
ncbi:MAG: ASCH domain-containing protein [Planctomycetota bacterium]